MLAAALACLALLGAGAGSASAAEVSWVGGQVFFRAPEHTDYNHILVTENNRTLVTNTSSRGPGVVYFSDSGWVHDLNNPPCFSQPCPGPRPDRPITVDPATFGESAPCRPDEDGRRVVCTGVRAVHVELGGSNVNDRFTCVCVGPIPFIIDGQVGDDTLIGGDETDTLRGGDEGIFGGKDLLIGGGSNDTLRGGSYGDRIYGGPGNDTVNGEGQNDVVEGGDGRDTVIGDEGNDVLYGGSGNDTLDGGPGNDQVTGIGRTPPPASRARLEGDRLRGGNGDDVLTGWYGPDILDGGLGLDALLGDRGNDIFFARDGRHDIAIRGSTGYDIARADSFDIQPALSSIERLF